MPEIAATTSCIWSMTAWQAAIRILPGAQRVKHKRHIAVQLWNHQERTSSALPAMPKGALRRAKMRAHCSRQASFTIG